MLSRAVVVTIIGSFSAFAALASATVNTQNDLVGTYFTNCTLASGTTYAQYVVSINAAANAVANGTILSRVTYYSNSVCNQPIIVLSQTSSITGFGLNSFNNTYTQFNLSTTAITALQYNTSQAQVILAQQACVPSVNFTVAAGGFQTVSLAGSVCAGLSPPATCGGNPALWNALVDLSADKQIAYFAGFCGFNATAAPQGNYYRQVALPTTVGPTPSSSSSFLAPSIVLATVSAILLLIQ